MVELTHIPMDPDAPEYLSPEWFKARESLVTASDVAALFGEHHIKSRTLYRVWHEKNGTPLDDDSDDGILLEFGRFIEPFIASQVQKQRPDWQIYDDGGLLVDAPNRIGATPDRFVKCPGRDGWGLLELKSAAGWNAKSWDEPPLGYLLQLQTQIGAAKLWTPEPVTWGAVAVLFGREQVKIYEYDSDPDIYEIIKGRVSVFWESIELGHEPEPDYERDAETIDRIFARATDGSVLDLSDDEAFRDALLEYHSLGGVISDANKRRKKVKAMLLSRVADADGVTCGDWALTAKYVEGNPGRPAKPGEIVGARRGYRTLRVKAPKVSE